MALRYKDLREDSDKLQRDIAKILNVKENTYGSWERTENDMPLEMSCKIANYYNVSMDYLLGLSNKKKKVLISKEINYNLLTKRLLKLRKHLKISQTYLGDRVGLNQMTYSHYERGDNKPTTLKLLNIAEFYHVSMDYLVGRSDNLKMN